MTKKEVYAKYGITYKNGKILSPWGTWIAELLKEGNTKTGKKVLTWSCSQERKTVAHAAVIASDVMQWLDFTTCHL